MRSTAVLVVVLASFALPSMGSAHDARPVVVHLQEGTEGIQVQWRVPRVSSMAAPPELQIPEGCKVRMPPAQTPMGDSLRVETSWDCEGPLAGKELRLTWPLFNPGLSTLFRAELESGETHSQLLPPGKETWTVPDNGEATGPASGFLLMGIRHILLGLDHLLFAVCLMMIAGTPRRIVMTVTGFTVAHAITLALSTFGLVALPNSLVEAAIALSIVFVAAEIARGNRQTLTFRYPVVAAMIFGLLHGFGFASVLREAGLAGSRAFAALFSFNVGVEAGQLLLIAVIGIQVLSLRHLARRSGTRAARLLGPGRLEPAAAYVIGVAAMFWTVQRLFA